jgi:hypothetical protein
MSAVNAAKLRVSCVLEALGGVNPLGSRSRVGLDVDTPDLGVKVECLQGSVSAEVLENIDVLQVSLCVLGARGSLPRYHRSIVLRGDPQSTCW